MAYRGGNDQNARNSLARARGFKSFFQWRSTIANKPVPSPARQQFGDGIEYVYTRDEGKLRAAIKRAAKNDLRLYPRVTVLLDPEDGSHPRTWPEHNIELWSKGGYSAIDAEALIDRWAFGMIADQIAELAQNAQGLSAANGAVYAVLLRVEP